MIFVLFTRLAGVSSLVVTGLAGESSVPTGFASRPRLVGDSVVARCPKILLPLTIYQLTCHQPVATELLTPRRCGRNPRWRNWRSFDLGFRPMAHYLGDDRGDRALDEYLENSSL